MNFDGGDDDDDEEGDDDDDDDGDADVVGDIAAWIATEMLLWKMKVTVMVLMVTVKLSQHTRTIAGQIQFLAIMS